jgi:rubrerythrin
MRVRFYLWLLLALAPLCAIRDTTAKRSHQMSSQTRTHLRTAMRTEAFNYAKYSLYAQQARRNGNDKLADLFEKAANAKRYEHFDVEAKLVGLVETEAENLKDAIQGESRDEVMYFDLAKDAVADGDALGERHFDEFRRKAAEQRDAFKAVLSNLDTNSAP